MEFHQATEALDLTHGLRVKLAHGVAPAGEDEEEGEGELEGFIGGDGAGLVVTMLSAPSSLLLEGGSHDGECEIPLGHDTGSGSSVPYKVISSEKYMD